MYSLINKCRLHGFSTRSAFVWLYIFFTIFSLRAELVSDSTEVHFRVSRSELDLNYDGNGERLSRLLDWLRIRQDNDSIYTLKHIAVSGAASPEGPLAFNRRLSEDRAASIFSFFKQKVNLPDSATNFDFLGRDWTGLLEAVRFNTRVPYRREVLSLLSPVEMNNALSDAESDALLSQLKSLENGMPYHYLLNNVFPSLRFSKLTAYYDKIRNPLKVDTVPIPLPGLMAVVPPADVDIREIFLYSDYKPCRPFYMALKTNMLHDALALPSIGAEFYLGKKWSIVGNWTYGWWSNDSRHRYWRAYGGDIALRRWFGKKASEKPLTGHHLGIYAGAFTYDFEFGGKGYMGGRPGHSLWDRCMLNAGVEYGYSLPIARRLNIDFTIGVGYVTGKVVKYHPEGNQYIWDVTKRVHWVGPTKAEISLVWLIGCDNTN